MFIVCECNTVDWPLCGYYYYRFAVTDSKADDATNVHFKSAFQCVNRSKAATNTTHLIEFVYT